MSGGRRDGVLSPQAGPCANKKPTSVNCHTAVRVSVLVARVRGKGAEGGVELSLPRVERPVTSDFRGRARPRTTSAPATCTSGLRCLSAGAGAVPEVVEARA